MSAYISRKFSRSRPMRLLIGGEAQVVRGGTGYAEISRMEATGQKVIDPEATIKIGLLCFRATFLKQILETMEFCGCKEAAVTLGSSTVATRFNITDEIDIILMPVNQDNSYKTIHLKGI
ncbi:hypothetical protein [uncultured Muribaculum sp.]|nr:hypothetical protein [uncultured Muribaculum sp.]